MSSDATLGGIDIGGTKIGVCVGDGEGRVVAQARLETRPLERPASQLEAALGALDDLSSGRVDRIGVSAPGPYDRHSRTLLTPPNLPGWHDFDLGAFFDRAAHAPTRIMNDANSTALAEWLWGGHPRAGTLVYLTMSTGFGAGIVVHGYVLEGARGFAGEVGRIRLGEYGPVGFGAYATAEGFCSGPGIVQLAEAEVMRRRQSGEPTALASLERITTEAICDLAAADDPGARWVTDLTAQRLGELIAIVANIVEPELVVLGTIGAAHPELFIPRATEAMRAHTVPHTARNLTIVPSTLEQRGARSALAAATIAGP
jgi:glucokinase